MNEILRKQIWRKLETLPDDKAYAVLDYIEFLEDRHGVGAEDARGFQRFGELFQERMRKARMPASALRETMKVLGATDRVLDAFREAGREFLAELEEGKPEPSSSGATQPPRKREVVVE